MWWGPWMHGLRLLRPTAEAVTRPALPSSWRWYYRLARADLDDLATLIGGLTSENAQTVD